MNKGNFLHPLVSYVFAFGLGFTLTLSDLATLRMASNLQQSCLCLLVAEITGICHYIRFTQYRTDPGRALSYHMRFESSLVSNF